MRFKFLTFIFLILLLPITFASYDWIGEANAGRCCDDYESRMTGYGLNMRNYQTTLNTSYSKCAISGSSFTPIVIDSVGDTQGHIITGSASTITIYDRTCGIVQAISLSEAFKSMPQITNWNSDDYLEITIPIAKGILQYQWSPVSNSYLLTNTITNNSISTINYIACPLLTNYCLAFNTTTSATYLINGSTSLIKQIETHTGTSSAYSHGSTTGVSSIQNPAYVPYCFIGQLTGHTYFECAIYSEEDILYTPNFGSITYSPYQQAYISAFYAWLGTNNRLFFSGRGYDSPSGNPKYMFEAAISDGISTTLFSDINVQAADATRTISGWSVADFNKDGYNEACYMHAEGTTTYMKCLDSSLTTILDTNVTGIMSLNNFVMADFITDAPYLSFGSYEGIFYYNTTINSIQKWFSSNLNGSVTGFPIVYKDGSGSTAPIMIYSDASLSFVIKLADLTINCGNEICDSSENAFTCPADCNETIGEGLAPDSVAVNGSLCASGYTEYGLCALRPGKMECTLDSQCLSGECSAGYCNNPSLWDGIAASKNQQFGNDEKSNNFVALFISIGIGLGIVVMSKGSLTGAILGAGSFLALLIFFTLVEWLSPWILLGALVFTIAVGFIVAIVFKGG